MAFVQKWRFFYLLFLCKMDQDEVISEVLERNETFLDLKNIVSKKPKKSLHFSFSWFLSKKWRLVNLLFLWKIDLENLFCEVFEIDEAF